MYEPLPYNVVCFREKFMFFLKGVTTFTLWHTIAEPTDEDIAKWREVFHIHAKAMGKTTKPKTDNQIRKWLQNPRSDSAEYKMWGNGVALPNVYFVLSGIMYYAQESAT